jgi:hypothetical protein
MAARNEAILFKRHTFLLMSLQELTTQFAANFRLQGLGVVKYPAVI